MNLFVRVFCGTIVQAMDNYLVYTRYMLVCFDRNAEESKSYKVLFIIILYFSWLLFYTILPIFTNVNDITVIFFYIGFVFYLIPYILFDLYCMAAMALVWRQLHSRASPTFRETAIVVDVDNRRGDNFEIDRIREASPPNEAIYDQKVEKDYINLDNSKGLFMAIRAGCGCSETFTG